MTQAKLRSMLAGAGGLSLSGAAPAKAECGGACDGITAVFWIAVLVGLGLAILFGGFLVRKGYGRGCSESVHLLPPRVEILTFALAVSKKELLHGAR